ncbi:MAG: 2-oxoacid:acceptor oxidoreductase family protein [Verrucomicrobia bacterium]|nr:2-oxoacid:acceptor oxidoreductase family protein [Verrucomicrobiota bacterium]MDA1087209.1 2-oxoacid:acceptor oxidoreductase family protein [Verrucomicrobiota bacterium]
MGTADALKNGLAGTTTPDALPKPKYPGMRITCTGNQLVAEYTDCRITDGGIFYPITPSTEMGEIYQQSYADGKLNVFGDQKFAAECEGEHAAQGGAIAFSVTGRRVSNFTSGQGIVYGLEQYYHAPGKLSTLVVQVGARALTKHALNVHCGHDDIYAALDTGWTMLMAKEAQQAADQSIIMRKVNELALNPGMNILDGMLSTHTEKMFNVAEADMLREYLGRADDQIPCPTAAQRELFGPTRRRVPKMIDLKHPILLGPVQNQEHHMNGVVARRNNFCEPILRFIEDAYEEFARLTGRYYGLLSLYKTDDVETVFVSLGSAAENIEAAVDHLRTTRGASVGSIHVNVIRPFPEAAVINALKGKKNVIIIERTDEPLAGDNPLTRDIRAALGKALEASRGQGTLPPVRADEMPRIFSGAYGIGSRDFRPEHTLGAYEFATGQTKREDGKGADDGVSYFTLGVKHPYAVISTDTPSLLPDKAIAVRLHSIGGWGMITTGKNLGAIIGEFGSYFSLQNPEYDQFGRALDKVHISANPKYGSEKKGSPTNYFLVVAPEPIRVNCDLRHVDVVLCCDPKAFTHTNPLDGLKPGGCFVWESDEDPHTALERIPAQYHDFIHENNIRIFTLPGFDIARKATDRADLQLRMQGNSFLGAFFKVSSFLKDYGIDEDQYREIVRTQYEKKFGRFGQQVVESNMEVMKQGGDRLREVVYDREPVGDRSSLRADPLLPADGSLIMPTAGCGACPSISAPPPAGRAPLQTLEKFDSEFRAGLEYHQPASALSSVGVMAAGTGATSSKYVARRETPVFIAENCTQCMACITACPDTALPNTAQDVASVLRVAAKHYVSDADDRQRIFDAVPQIDDHARAAMLAAIQAGEKTPFVDIVRAEIEALDGLSDTARQEYLAILNTLPLAYTGTKAIFSTKEKKEPGQGGLFSIFVSDLCKGCGECVEECGDHDALRMTAETEDLNATHATAQIFSRLLPDTRQKYLGLYNDDAPEDSKEAVLRNHLMVRRNYEALVSGDGACAGCGEKSILRALATVTEAYMRPTYHAKAARLTKKADLLEREGVVRLEALKAHNEEEYLLFRRSVAHLTMGLGGEDDKDTQARMQAHGEISDDELIAAIVAVMRQDAINHSEWQTIDGRLANGMSVMAMGASTGCNTVYGSTPPSNPHPYPWMNSLFQDGATISWMIGESFILDHGRRSVVPERLCDALLDDTDNVITERDYFDYTHMAETLMTDLEIKELPIVWALGGDGAFGDIGYQNVSKAVLQNRPNMKMMMLDTQVYSNTGGQNSDSSLMVGGFDMNQFGSASQGKLSEKKSVAESLTSGHGSPFVAQVSMANTAKLYRAILDGLEYRGVAFFQCFTTCQPEHGVADDMSTRQAQQIRDSRGMPEFIFNPQRGETYQEALDVKGNPLPNKDFWETKYTSNGETYCFTVAHWATSEARFRKHLKKISEEEAAKLVNLEDMILRVAQDDVINRRIFDESHRAFVPDFGSYIKAEVGGKLVHYALTRQMVLFTVERRKAWRMLQSKAGIVNKDYLAQKAVLKKVDAGDIPLEDLFTRARELVAEELAALKESR